MKHFFIAGAICFCYSIASAQTRQTDVSHHGFYLSLGTGAVFGNIHGSDNYGDRLTIKGTAAGVDIQIGGSVRENLLLHATLGVKSIFGFKINDQKIDGGYSFDEDFLGLGVTKYTKKNFFATANAGIATYGFSNDNITSTNDDHSTKAGFSFNVKAGKEWAIGKRMGLGGTIFYSRTYIRSAQDGMVEKWGSNRVGIYFQAAYNKTRK